MKIAELRHVLEELLRSPAASDRPGTVAALQTLASALAAFDDQGVDEFCRSLKPVKMSIANAKKAAKRKPAKPLPSVAAVPPVGRYLHELEQTKANSQQFEDVIARMKKDRSVGVADAGEIARRFTGSSQQYKTKPAAIKAILQRQITDIRNVGKLERIADIF